MNKKNYRDGEKICKDLFWKTGDLRYYNMAGGFIDLYKKH